MMIFHKIISGCEGGSLEAWSAFLAEYTPLVQQLNAVYFSLAEADRDLLWQDVLRRLAANQCELMKSFSHQAEREFLVDWRGLLLSSAAPRVPVSADSSAGAPPSFESAGKLLPPLPLIDQEKVYLKLAGYSDGTIEQILRTSPEVTRKAMQVLEAGYGGALGRKEDKCLWPSAWLELVRRAEAAKTADCLEVRRFIRVIDGQSGWDDKTVVENHVVRCLHCLNRWVAVREMSHWKRVIKPAGESEGERFVACLPFNFPAKRKPSLLGKLWRKGGAA
jgi:hypothetical protein